MERPIICEVKSMRPIKTNMDLKKLIHGRSERHGIGRSEILFEMNVQHVCLFRDSILVVKQVLGDFSYESITLGAYCNKVRHLMARFLEARLENIERNSNSEANNLI